MDVLVVEADAALASSLLGALAETAVRWCAPAALEEALGDGWPDAVVVSGGVLAVARVSGCVRHFQPRLGATPKIVAVYDLARVSDPSALLDAGADDCEALPVDGPRLTTRLRVALRRKTDETLRRERDVTQAALSASESLLRSLFDAVPMMMGLVELAPPPPGETVPDLVVISCNRATATWFGFDDPGQLRNRGLAGVGLHTEARARYVSVLRSVTATAMPVHREIESSRAGVWLAVAANQVDGVSPSGHPRFCFVLEDITERMRLQTQLVMADRLVSLGTLAAGVAHEINNPLMWVISNLEFVGRQLAVSGLERADAEGHGRVVRSLSQAREGVERVRQIVRSLRTFSRGDDERRGALVVPQVIDTSIEIAWNQIRHRATLRRAYQSVPPVEANEARLGQVFLNLLVNAAQAIPEDAPADAHEIVVSTWWDSTRERVVIEVRDTGRGIARELLGRVFDPFFTTKPVGEGTGLGLAICHGIVRSLKGDMEVESEPGKGSAFRVLLPAAKTGSQPKKISTPPVGPARPVRVLVVDDEPNLRTSLAQILSIEHEVEALESARMALEKVRAGCRWDVVLCDVMMPDMSGVDLYRALEHEAPELLPRTVFLTGGAFTQRAAEFLAAVPNPRLEKPFEIDDLRLLIQKVSQRELKQ